MCFLQHNCSQGNRNTFLFGLEEASTIVATLLSNRWVLLLVMWSLTIPSRSLARKLLPGGGLPDTDHDGITIGGVVQGI